MKIKAVFLSLALAAAAVFAPTFAAAQYPGQQSAFSPNFSPPAQSFTATAQTGTTINLIGYSAATIEVYGTSLTTVSFQMLASNDGGAHFFPISTAVNTTPGTTATTQTATTATMYIANVASYTNVKFVTSGTFTATGLYIKATFSGNRGLL